jgi:phospholipid-transporting ATPase
VEDRLQEGVKGTIKSLYEAGIRIWMITGDKKETALSCAHNSGVITRSDRGNTSQVSEAKSILDKIARNEDICEFESLIIYRASPDQKAKIARHLVQKGKTVLSIGDGNNDVSMLQNSSIGVGIKGYEGTQASLTADFSVPQFQCLKRLLLIHGRYNFMRFSKLTLNSFYKNLFLIVIQFYYNFYNGYSGRPVFNFFFLNYYNVLFTSFIPLTISLFDKDYPEEYLLDHPKRYEDCKDYFSNKAIFSNILLSLVKASVAFWLSYFIFETKDFTGRSGLPGGYTAMNNYFSLIVFATVFVRQIRLISYYVVFSYIAMVLTAILYFSTIFGIQEIDSELNGGALHLYCMPVFYVSALSVLSLLFFIDFLYDIMHTRSLVKA